MQGVWLGWCILPDIVHCALLSTSLCLKMFTVRKVEKKKSGWVVEQAGGGLKARNPGYFSPFMTFSLSFKSYFLEDSKESYCTKISCSFSTKHTSSRHFVDFRHQFKNFSSSHRACLSYHILKLSSICHLQDT